MKALSSWMPGKYNRGTTLVIVELDMKPFTEV